MTTYLDFTATQQYEFHRRGLCHDCGLSHSGDCRARFCDSCTQFWLAETPEGGEGRPAEEYCPECWKCDHCGFRLDEENIGGTCEDCKADDKRQVAEAEYWQQEIGLPIPESIRELAAQMEAATDKIISDLEAKADEAVKEAKRQAAA